ncbi:MAG: hypothetical protein AABM30_12305 [Actinomycetota bacterium]
MIRLRLFLERIGLKRVLAAALVVVALVAAGVVFAVVQGGGKKASTTASSTSDYTNLFYLQARAPKVQVRGCLMYIRFTWKPDYHADQYLGAPALIMASGTGIEGAYRKTFKASGMSLDVGPITLGGGYRLWSAKVASLDGDPPGNSTLIQAGPPASASAKCG